MSLLQTALCELFCIWCRSGALKLDIIILKNSSRHILYTLLYIWWFLLYLLRLFFLPVLKKDQQSHRGSLFRHQVGNDIKRRNPAQDLIWVYFGLQLTFSWSAIRFQKGRGANKEETLISEDEVKRTRDSSGGGCVSAVIKKSRLTPSAHVSSDPPGDLWCIRSRGITHTHTRFHGDVTAGSPMGHSVGVKGVCVCVWWQYVLYEIHCTVCSGCWSCGQ